MSERIYTVNTDRLTKKYRDKQALDALTVSIADGGITGLIGRNGSGKTTFLKICAGLLDKTSGKAEIMGRDPMDDFETLSNLVYTYHDMKYEKSLRLKEIIGNYGMMFRDFDSVFAENLLRYFDLEPKLKYAQLSQGMASIFNFICGLACRSKLTIFDEPVLGMDITVRKSAYEVLLRDYSEYPRTIVISSHLLSEIEGVLTDILLIDEGRLVLHENIDDLRQISYMAEGGKERIDAFCEGRNVVFRKDMETGSSAVIYEKFDENASAAANAGGVRLSAVRPEDLCIYLTRENKEGELECLWKKPE